MWTTKEGTKQGRERPDRPRRTPAPGRGRRLQSAVENSAARRNRAAIQRRYRLRNKCGEASYSVAIGPQVIDLLVRARWLPDRDVYDLVEVAEAAAAMLRDAARRN
jgi:hypothetical protein